MTKARLIKSHEQAAPPAKASVRPAQTESKMKATVNEWRQHWQATRPKNAREQFAALFA